MKSPLLAAALVAVASSLATVGLIELVRGSRPGVSVALAERTTPEAAPRSAPRGTDLSPARPIHRPPEESTAGPDYTARLEGLERRIAALELRPGSQRTPLGGAESGLAPGDDLRQLVLDWVAEEREARWREEELEDEQHRRRELEFEARFHAHMMAREYGLEDWQADKLAQTFLEVEQRRWELEESIDLERDDPAEVEDRWEEFDEWADQLEREVTEELDPELYEEIYGEEDGESEED